MKKSKSELEMYLSNRCQKIVFQTEACSKIMKLLYEKFNISMGKTMDMIAQRVSLSEETEFILFCLAYGIDNTEEKSNIIKDYFIEIEVETYLKSKYEEDKIEFPIVIKCSQVTSDQWIGATDSNFLMKLRKAQMINYNVNAQRTMQKIVKGGKEIWRVSLNKKAITEIRDSFKKEIYIPTSITLNIATNEDADFYYDAERYELIIRSLNHFDISDGYHRYIAMCQENDENPDFNYPTEIRIVNFMDDKTKQFIFQEDQKTKMSKVNSDSMNMNNPANTIVERLNQSTMFNLKGCISRNEGLINFGEMAALVNWFYIKNGDLSSNSSQIKAIREITDNLNLLTENDMSLLDKSWNYKYLLSVMCVFDYIKQNNVKVDNVNKIVKLVYNTLLKEDNKKFNNKTPRKALIDMVTNIVSSVI